MGFNEIKHDSGQHGGDSSNPEVANWTIKEIRFIRFIRFLTAVLFYISG